MDKQIIEYINAKKPSAVSIEELQGQLKIATAEDSKTFFTSINLLIANGELMQNKNGKYLTPYSLGYYKGILRGNQKGFAFLLREEGEDIFIPARCLNGAFDGDTVYVKPLQSTRGNSTEGEVIKTIIRGRTEVIGTFVKSGKFGFVISDDKRFTSDIYIDQRETMSARSGDKVVAKITKYQGAKRKNPEGKITQIIGSISDPMIDILSVLRANGIKDAFEIETIAEAEKMPKEVFDKDITGRRDFTKDIVITIDGEDAKDLDDAVSVELLESGVYRLCVHIADVTHYVKSNSPIDKEALKRGTSVYFPGMVIPMLPRQLSNNICSLNENVKRLTLSVIIEIDKGGKVVGHEIVEGVIQTVHRMTYTSVTKILNGDKKEQKQYPSVVSMIEKMSELSQLLTANKKRRGSIDFDMQECKIEVDECGKVLDVTPYERTISHRLIEEFMILANETVAEFMFHLNLPFIYRVHENPNEEKVMNFKKFLSCIGVTLKTKGELHARQLLDILDEIKELPIYSVVNRVMLKTMQKAKYSPDNLGHFGLASKYYCHFTSPIRRYPDLMIHRIIKYMLSGKLDENLIIKLNARLYEIANQNSESEKKADEAEREIDELKKAEYMKDKIGNVFDGVISGVTNFGIFVELNNTVEGIIKIDKLPKDVYNYNENAYLYKGSKHSYRLGDKISIIVDSVNTDSRRVEFIVNEDDCAE